MSNLELRPVVDITIRGYKGAGKTHIARALTDLLINEIGVSRVEYQSADVYASTDAAPGTAKVTTVVRIVEVQRRAN